MAVLSLRALSAVLGALASASLHAAAAEITSAPPHPIDPATAAEVTTAPPHPIDPATPPRLAAHEAVQHLLAGFVDPTLPPYNAAGDGVADGPCLPTGRGRWCMRVAFAPRVSSMRACVRACYAHTLPVVLAWQMVCRRAYVSVARRRPGWMRCPRALVVSWGTDHTPPMVVAVIWVVGRSCRPLLSQASPHVAFAP